MRAMAVEFASTEIRGDFQELKQRMGPGVTFLIEAQQYLTAAPMPLGLEAVCLMACAHYFTLLDRFQRDLRDVLNGLQSNVVVDDWLIQVLGDAKQSFKGKCCGKPCLYDRFFVQTGECKAKVRLPYFDDDN